MRIALRTIPAAASTLALGVSLAACSSGGGGTLGGLRPPTGTEPAARAEVRSSGPDAGGGPVPGATFATGALRAVEQADSVKLSGTTSLPGGKGTSRGELRFGSGTTDAHVVEDLGGHRLEVVVLGRDVYVKGLTTNQAKPWTHDDDTETASLLQAADPRVLLEEIGTTATLTPTGTKQINGVGATGYRGTLDLRAIIRRLPDLKDSLDDVLSAGVTTGDVQVWVDDQQRVVRITTSMKAPRAGTGSPPATADQTVDFSDWGAPVTITAPPPSQVETR